jgi:hypothetical protein
LQLNFFVTFLDEGKCREGVEEDALGTNEEGVWCPANRLQLNNNNNFETSISQRLYGRLAPSDYPYTTISLKTTQYFYPEVFEMQCYW